MKRGFCLILPRSSLWTIRYASNDETGELSSPWMELQAGETTVAPYMSTGCRKSVVAFEVGRQTRTSWMYAYVRLVIYSGLHTSGQREVSL